MYTAVFRAVISHLRRAIYPNRKNFGSTLSSKCILRQGVPDDDLSPPLEYNSSEDEGTGGKKGKGKGKGPLLLMDKAAAASGKVVKAVSHKKGKPATSSQPVKSSSGTGYKSTTAPAAVPKPASSVSKLGSKAAPSKPSSKPPSPTPAPTTSVPKRESIFPRTSDAVPKPTAASAPVPAPASARSASKRKQDVISLLSSDDSEEEDSVEVFEVPPKKTPGKSPHSSPQKPSSRRSTSRK